MSHGLAVLLCRFFATVLELSHGFSKGTIDLKIRCCLLYTLGVVDTMSTGAID
jgi:hypothetical protein